MAAVPLTEGIWWVGAIDWDIRSFHGLSTPQGSSYNSYLVVGEKIALIDTVKADKVETLLRHIGEVVDPARIDYVISNHSEPDHSGGLPQIMAAAPNAQLIASKEGAKRLTEIFRHDWNITTVGDGDEISLGGGMNLQFINAPLLHWPETMMTWCPERQMLFSCDPFGAHVATTERFVDEVGAEYVLRYARKYFAYLIAAFRSAMNKAMKKLDGLDIKMIGPSHGPVWRQEIDRLLHAYQKWSSLELDDMATIIYGSMWGGTKKMAEAVADGLKEGGLESRAFNVELTDPSDIIAEAFLSRVVVMGSPTFESGIYPPVEGIIPFLRIPRDKSKQMAVFGSFGWSGGSARKLQEILSSEGYQLNDEPLTLKLFPDADGVSHCRAFGRRIAEWAMGQHEQENRSAAE